VDSREGLGIANQWLISRDYASCWKQKWWAIQDLNLWLLPCVG